MRHKLLIVAYLLLVLAPVSTGLAGPQTTGDDPFLLGVVSFYNPRLMYVKYQPLVDYLGEYTGSRWELRISTTHEEAVEQLCAGRLTAAYLDPFTYVRAHEACGADPVVRQKNGHGSTCLSYILVRADGDIRELSDLRGKRFGFGSALSTCSHLIPRAILEEAGIYVDDGLDCTYFGHQERAARAVLMGDVDACGVRDIVGERFLERGLRLLARSRPIPNFPLVVGPRASDEIRRRLLWALVELPEKVPATSRTMETWDEELARGFVTSTDAEYDDVRVLAKEILGPGALTLPEEELRCTGPPR